MHKIIPRPAAAKPASVFHTSRRCAKNHQISPSSTLDYTHSWPQVRHKTHANNHITVSKGVHRSYAISKWQNSFNIPLALGFCPGEVTSLTLCFVQNICSIQLESIPKWNAFYHHQHSWQHWWCRRFTLHWLGTSLSPHTPSMCEETQTERERALPLKCYFIFHQPKFISKIVSSHVGA